MKTRLMLPVMFVGFLSFFPARAITPLDFLRETGVQGGLVVHLGCQDATQVAKLRLNERYLVQGLETDPGRVDEAREVLRGQGTYGPVTVYQYDGKNLPYVDNLVNAILSEGPTSVSMSEVMRVLAPLGVAIIDGQKTVKPWPEAIDEWTHFLHSPDNNALALDKVVSAPRSIQWVAPPRWGRSHEELASMSATVTAKGRIFYIVDEAPLALIQFDSDWKLTARDAFNGTLLWKKDIPQWVDHLRHFRSGPAALARRLVAVGDVVYVTLGLSAELSALDAATGKLLRTYPDTAYTEEILVQDGVVYVVLGSSEVDRVGGGLSLRGEPEPTPFRNIAALDAATGKTLWKKDFTGNNFLLPLTLTLKNDKVLYQSSAGVGCLDALTGEKRWETPRATPLKRMSFSAPTLVATDDILLCADRDVDDKNPASPGGIQWGVNGWDEVGFPRSGKESIVAYDIGTGAVLWSVPCSEGYNSPVDIFVRDGVAWVGADFKGYDLKTGMLVRALDWKRYDVAMAHHRCYRDKASLNYIFTGRAGVELASFEDGWVGNNSWIRGTCQYGIMPANGLIYAPPDACACVPKVKVSGFFAAAPLRAKGGMQFPDTPLIEKGPAYGQPLGDAAAGAADWPMYRHDGARSGKGGRAVPENLSRRWTASVGETLTQPISVGNLVIVASTDTHSVYALNAENGTERWVYTAGGRIDSTPTYYEGMVLFGSADGFVYALRAADGKLVWRFRAAPQERQVGVFGQLESAWPVHGSVLVQNDTIYVTAGRSTYLDGGIVLYRLDPRTGEVLSRHVEYLIDPETDVQTGAEDRKIYGFDMEGSTSDLLSGDGESVFMKHYHFDRMGNRTEIDKDHLFSVTGFLGEDWFVRSYWLVGSWMEGGWGKWANAAKAEPSGRILAVDGDRVWGYGRLNVENGATGHKADQYELFCERMPVESLTSEADQVKRRTAAKDRPDPVLWRDTDSLTVRAMVLVEDRLIIAGPPDLGVENRNAMFFDNEAEARAAFQGEKGVYLRTVSAEDGTQISECKLDGMPVFDGLSTANGRVYVALKNGTVTCYGE